MAMQSRKQLVDRWNEDSLRDVSEWLYGKMEKTCPAGECEFNGKRYADLRGYKDLSNLIPDGAKLEHVDLSFGEVMLTDCIVSDSRFVQANFEGVLAGHFFERCCFSKAKFTSGTISQTIFIECDFSNAKMANCLCFNTSFIRCDFRGADFRDASLGMQNCPATYFAHCDLTDVKFGSRSAYNEFNNPPGITKRLECVRFVSCVVDSVDWGGSDLTDTNFYPRKDRPARG